MRSQALVPDLLSEKGNSLQQNLLVVFGGTVLLAVLAQVSIRLPFTPIPITGQTFGVALVALLWGSSRAGAVLALYIALGAVGAPIFALGRSGLVWGPTAGYLAGMLLSSIVIGTLSDRGWSKSFGKSFLAAICGSICVFSMGLLVLSRFVPTEHLLVAGLFPFLAGDFIKNFLAATIASQVRKRF